MILRCFCKHEYQDAKHGPEMRVHNATTNHVKYEPWRCTVCGRERKP